MRTSFTLPQVSVAIADWAPKNGIKKVVTLVTDYGPGIDAEKYFKERFAAQRRPGASRACACRCATPTSRLSCRRCATPSRTRCSSFVPSGAGAALMKQFAERGLDKAGIKLIGTGDVTDDDILNNMGDVRAGRGDFAPLFGGASVGREQEVRRGIQEGQQRHAPQLHGGGRLRRHAA